MSIIDSLHRSSYRTAIVLFFTGGVFLYFVIRYYYFGKKHPFYNVSIKQSILIKDRTGKLVQYKNDRTFRPNYPYISRTIGTVTSDGTIENFFATVSDSNIRCTYRILPYLEKFKLCEVSFSEYLEKNKEYRIVSGFDFINSYTQSQEYHVFRIEMVDKIFSFSVIFPQGRLPKSINCFCTKGETFILKSLPPAIITPLPDGYKEYNWVIKRPRIGNTYKVKWEW